MQKRIAWKKLAYRFMQVLLLLALLLWAMPAAPVRASGSLLVNTVHDYFTEDAYLDLREALAVANGTLTGPFTDGEHDQLGGCIFSGSSYPWNIIGGCGLNLPDTISFSYNTGVIILDPELGVLPDISDYGITNIDGPTASGSEIMIDGYYLAAGPILTISSEFNQIKDRLAFTRSPDVGLNITGNSNYIDSVHVYGNKGIGLQISGDNNDVLYSELGFRSLSNPESCDPNTDNEASNLVLADGAEHNTIRDNTIVCSPWIGLGVTGVNAASNTLSYNDIGVWNRPAVMRLLGNGLAGVAIAQGSHENDLHHNLIGANGAGILLLGEGTDSNGIHDNQIGKYLSTSTPNQVGVSIGGKAQSNQVYSNTIGMNTQAGVSIDDTIANSSLVENNIISGNGTQGIVLQGSTTDNTIRGNNIFSNGEAGILLAESAFGNLIETGTIHHNTGAGIVQETSAGPNLWRNLQVYANGGLGIDIGANGIPDGPYPTITGFESAGPGALAIVGTAELSTAVELYRVDPDPSGFGEGKTRVGTASTDGSGHWSITVTAGGFGTFTALQAKSTPDGPDASEFGPNVGWLSLYLPLTGK